MRNSNFAVVLSTMLLAAAGAAHATTTASSSMTGITFQLIDLNPSDGIAPALTFLNGAGMPWTVYGHASNTQFFDAVTNRQDGDRFGTEHGEISAIRDVASLQSAMSGDPFKGTGAISAQGSAERTGYALGWGLFHGDFTLTANTQLLISAQVTLSGAITGDGKEEAGSQYYLNLGGNDSFDSEQRFMNAIPLAGEAAGVAHDYFLNQAISVTLLNQSASSTTGYFDVGSTVSVNNNIVAVPEPQSWALMLSGVGGLLAFMRRRAK